MADEATITSSLVIQKRSGSLTLIDYQSKPSQFRLTVTGTLGPTPGAFLATVEGTDVDLSALTVPGLCRIANLDPTNYVQVGRWDPDSNKFYPLMRIHPGKSYVICLDPDVNEEYSGTGTGTTSAASTLRIKANTDDCNVLVEAFEA